MDSDRDDSSGRVRLPGFGGSDQEAPAGPGHPDDAPYSPERAAARRDGVRRARRVSNWTAAALIAGTGAAALALAHPALPAAAQAAGGASSATGTGSTATAPGATGPQVSHSVATTSGSGVTTTTTTRTVNGKTVVTHVRHVPAYTDN